MAKGSKIKTPVGEFNYVFIKGEGRNQAMAGEEAHFMYVASVVLEKDSKQHKAIKADIDAEWKQYAADNNVKGGPKTNGIKPVMVATDKLDEYGEPIKEEGNQVIVTFKTNITWPNGNAKEIKVFDHKGTDVTKAVTSAEWSIGSGSTGLIHGLAMGNSVGGSDKVSLYLNAVQIGKLVKYEGDSIDADEIDGEDLGEDLGDAVSAMTEDETPDL